MRSPFRRNGAALRQHGASINLQLPSGDHDGWNDARPMPDSGIWIVLRMSKSAVQQGDWPRRGADHYETTVREAASGLEAIQKSYEEKLGILKHRDGDLSNADGRYVAVDYYGGGERVEALIVGGWKADLELAPQALGPPR